MELKRVAAQGSVVPRHPVPLCGPPGTTTVADRNQGPDGTYYSAHRGW
ncbi:hypothetical protein [Nakamurella sp.]